MFIKDAFSFREKAATLVGAFFDECVKIGLNSVLIFAVISTFTGAVTTLQTAYNFSAPYLPQYLIAVVVRDMVFGIVPTLMALVFAGKVGSSIAGELGTMRISEQIDALEVMGINATSFLVLPKVLASLVMLPALTIIACFLAFTGGYLVSIATGILSGADYIYGIRSEFHAFSVNFVLIKSFAFGFIVSAISAYKGFYTLGGALEVGKASTRAVVSSCIGILCADYLLTQVLVG